MDSPAVPQVGAHLRGNTQCLLQARQLACALCMRLNPGGTLARAPRAGDAAAMYGRRLSICMRAVHASKPWRDPCPGTPRGGRCSDVRTEAFSLHARCACV
jgi:hypothetical protein